MSKKDWENHLKINIRARHALQFWLTRLLRTLQEPEAAGIRTQLGAEYLMSLRSAKEACERLIELTADWGSEFRRAHSMDKYEQPSEEEDPADWWKQED